MRQIERDRSHHGARQRAAADLRAAGAHSGSQHARRQPVEGDDDPLGADAQIVVRRAQHLENRNVCVAAQIVRPPSFQGPTE